MKYDLEKSQILIQNCRVKILTIPYAKIGKLEMCEYINRKIEDSHAHLQYTSFYLLSGKVERPL